MSAESRARIDGVLDHVETLPEGVQAEVRVALRAVLDITGAGVVALLERLHSAGVAASDLAGDDDIGALLAMCGLEPVAATPVSIGERPECDLCAATMGSTHEHAADTEARRLLCVCRACAISLNGAGRFQTLRSRLEKVSEGGSPPAWWDELDLPVQLVFFVNSSASGGIAGFYPGIGGVVEADASIAELPVDLVVDAEALLVRNGVNGFEAWRVPVDRCYELAGELRHAPMGVPVDHLTEAFFAGLAR